MIKLQQKRSIYATYQITFLKQLLKKTFESSKKNRNIEESMFFMDKVINVVQLLVQSNGEKFLLLLRSSC